MRTASRDPLNLNRLAYFAYVVEASSFTRAAERLGITKAVVSQQVARLEREVGTTLLVRTTRKVVPTEAGRALHARCTVILRESAEAFDELAQGVAEPRGKLRVTAPFDYGTSVVAPVAAEFTRTYPHCDVELMLGDRLVDVQTVDLAIRVGWPRDSSHVMRRIGTMEQYLVCTPKTAMLLGRGSEPEDIGLLPFVANGSLPEPNVWRFTHPEHGRRTVRTRARITVDATPAAHVAVLAGAGTTVLPDYLVSADLAAGRLVRVLPDWKLRSGGIHALFPPTRFRSPKVSRFFESMVRAEKRIRAQGIT
ncbi:LysR family transcriptional regulator [Pendulispora rubella]|uniref:LysR family transcriptional regulator n=1 Tax=Pendulispora rubella TaxID=2741070 RepID=A0ABZ2L122_9BACT